MEKPMPQTEAGVIQDLIESEKEGTDEAMKGDPFDVPDLDEQFEQSKREMSDIIDQNQEAYDRIHKELMNAAHEQPAELRSQNVPEELVQPFERNLPSKPQKSFWRKFFGF